MKTPVVDQLIDDPTILLKTKRLQQCWREKIPWWGSLWEHSADDFEDYYSDKTPQKVFIIHDVIGQQVGVVDHWKNAYFRKLQSNISVSPTSHHIRSWFIKDEVSYFLGRKILRAYLIQTLPSSDLQGGSKFSPSGTEATRVNTGSIQMKQTYLEILAADLFWVLVDELLDTMAL